MPYIGIKRDKFRLRCRAALEGRYLPKFSDLLRCGPYFRDSLKEDIKEFTRLSTTKFSAHYAEHYELRELLAQVHESSFMADYQRVIELTGSKLWPQPDNPFGTLVNRRFRYYLASMRDLEQMRWVALECLNRIAGGWIDAETSDYMKAALGWATHIRYYDDPDYYACDQNIIKSDGNNRLFNIIAFDGKP